MTSTPTQQWASTVSYKSVWVWQGIKTYSAIICKIILEVGQLRTHLKVAYVAWKKILPLK